MTLDPAAFFNREANVLGLPKTYSLRTTRGPLQLKLMESDRKRSNENEPP